MRPRTISVRKRVLMLRSKTVMQNASSEFSYIIEKVKKNNKQTEKQRIPNKYQNSNPLKFPLQVAPFVHPLQFVHLRIMIYVK